MTPRFNFAPVSGAQSSLLRIASGWFLFNGSFYELLVAVGILGLLLGKRGSTRRFWLSSVFSFMLLRPLGLFGQGRYSGAAAALVESWRSGFFSCQSRLRQSPASQCARRISFLASSGDCVVAHLARVAMTCRAYSSATRAYSLALGVRILAGGLGTESVGADVLRRRTPTSVIRLRDSCSPMSRSVRFWQLTSFR